ncbi:MAG: crossover junction endodeoxyribonuclease RuvC [Chloroflexi bacterium]|nr:crossover junction endodeoxyribonuclease RuvC [Chloroflexota bacterium]
MRVLGIDPGTATTGYGIIEATGNDLKPLAFGVITTPADLSLPVRLQMIFRSIKALAQQWHPDAAAVEELFFSKNVRTAINVGQARGVVLLAMAEAGLQVAEYTPLTVKQAVTGYGGADKRQVQEMIRLLLDLSSAPSPDDAADALAIAICHANTASLLRLPEE